MVLADWLNPQEIAEVTRRSDLRGACLVISNWLLIAAAMGLVVLWSNPLTWVIAIVVVGARQLGLAILMHEAGHNTLFKRRETNTVVASGYAPTRFSVT